MEEHISRQAQADVFELEQHSQEPANYVDKKLKVSLCDLGGAVIYITNSRTYPAQRVHVHSVSS